MSIYSELSVSEIEKVVTLRVRRRELYFLHLQAQTQVMKDMANRELGKVNRQLYLLTKNEIYL